MVKVLFVPTNSREVAQFVLVKHELEINSGCEVLAIALDEKMEPLLKEKGLTYKCITDYTTGNMLDIIKGEKPDIVMASFGPPVSKALILAANHVGVPCLQVDDGITSDYSALRTVPLWQSFLKIMRWIIQAAMRRKNPKPYFSFLITLMAVSSPWQFLGKATAGILKLTYPLPSYVEGLNMAVLSPFAKEAYISMGVPAEKIFITGQPRFDLIWQKEFHRERILKELGIPENKGIIVLATQPLLGFLWKEKDRERLIETVVRAMDKYPEEKLVVKLHPNESLKDYQELLTRTKCNNKVVICQNIDLYELLHACDLLMTVHSTVALEAMLLNKPVICLDFSGRNIFQSFYTESGAATRVRREEELVQAIQEALYNPQARDEQEQNRQRFISKHVYKPDGQASKRVAELIIQLIESAKARRKNA